MAQKKKKKTRRNHDDATKAAAVARAQEVGRPQSAREFDVDPNMLSRWAQERGVELPDLRRAPSTDEENAATPSAPPSTDAHPRSGPDTWSRKSNDSVEQRLAIVREALASPNRAEVARRHGVAEHTLGNWVHRHGDQVRASGNPEPRQVEVTPPTRQKRQTRPASVKLAVVERAKEIGVTAAAREIGVGASVVSRWVAKEGAEVPQFRFTPGRGTRRVDPEEMTTQLSRPAPPSRGQLPLYGNGNSEQQRVQATPAYDEAERAREQAQTELKDTLLRQALKEREAFKTVLDVLMREKNER